MSSGLGWFDFGWTQSFMRESPFDGFEFRKHLIDGLQATLQLKVLVRFLDKTTLNVDKEVLTIGMCSSYQIRSKIKECVNNALLDSKRKALDDVKKVNPQSSAYEFSDFINKYMEVEVLDYNVRYLVKDVNIKRISIRGRYFSSVRDKKTGRFKGNFKRTRIDSFDGFDDDGLL